MSDRMYRLLGLAAKGLLILVLAILAHIFLGSSAL